MLVIVDFPEKRSRFAESFRQAGMPAIVVSTLGQFAAYPPDAVELGLDMAGNEWLRQPRMDTLSFLQAQADRQDLVLIATDDTLEGEAIAADLRDHLNHPNMHRVRLRSLEPVDVCDAIARKEPLSNLNDGPAKAERVFDRLVSAYLARRGLNRGGRISAAILNVMCAEPVSIGEVALSHRGYSAVVPIRSGDYALWKKRVSQFSSIGMQQSGAPKLHEEVGSTCIEPYSMGELIGQVRKININYSVSEIAGALRGLFSAGQVTHPYTDSICLRRRHLLEYAELARSMRQPIRNDLPSLELIDGRVRGVHSAPAPLILDRYKKRSPYSLSGLPLGDQLHMVAVGRIMDALMFHRSYRLTGSYWSGGTPEWLKNIPLEKAESVAGRMIPIDRARTHTALSEHPADLVLLQLQLKAGLGRPETWVANIDHFQSREWVNFETWCLTSAGESAAQIVGQDELFDPALSATVERLLSEMYRAARPVTFKEAFASLIQVYPRALVRSLSAMLAEAVSHEKAVRDSRNGARFGFQMGALQSEMIEKQQYKLGPLVNPFGS